MHTCGTEHEDSGNDRVDATPPDRGVNANGWYFRDLNEVWFWRQSNQPVHGMTTVPCGGG